MTKKVMSFALAIALCLSLSTTVLATNNPSTDFSPNVTVVNLSNNLPDQELQEIVDSTVAYIKQDDGTIAPVSSTITVEDIPVTNRSRNTTSVENTYKVTINATLSEDDNDKNVTNSKDKNSSAARATATLTIVWTDNLGPENEFKEVSGSLRVDKGTVESAELRYGDSLVSALKWRTVDVTGRDEFAYYPNWTTPCPVADYSIKFEGDGVTLYVHVSSSIFQ